MIERIVRLLNQLFQNVMKEVLINATLIVVKLCHRWARTSWVDPLQNHAADIVYLFRLNLWQGSTTISVETTKYISACIINPVINVSCIAHMMCSAFWRKIWRDYKLASFPGRQTMVDGCHSEGNECRVELINQWSIFHIHLSYGREICLVYKLHNFSHCKLKLALLNWLSRQWLHKMATLNLPHEGLLGM